MTRPRIALSTLREAGADAPVLVVGPSLGTAVRQLWQPTIDRLSAEVSVIGWDLPGHGASAAAADFTVADLADAVAESVEGRFAYAGDSLGGAVGLQLLLEHPDRVSRAVLCCTGPRLGTPASWRERAGLVRTDGLIALVEATPERWFAAPFRETPTAVAMVEALTGWDAQSYAACCEALAGFDVRDRLADIEPPVLALAGAEDVAAPVAGLRQIAGGVQHGRLVVLDGVAHLAPVEAPDRLAALITAELVAPPAPTPTATLTAAAVRAAGMRVRREVLGDDHVDRAQAGTSALTTDFQDLITGYAWGSIWTRPGLDRRSRSMITLTALIARGHHEELAMHLRAARTNGLTREEITEVILQSAIYCGVPDANAAFKIAQHVLEEDQG